MHNEQTINKLRTMAIDINQHLSEIVEDHEHTAEENTLKITFNNKEVEIEVVPGDIQKTVETFLKDLSKEV